MNYIVRINRNDGVVKYQEISAERIDVGRDKDRKIYSIHCTMGGGRSKILYIHTTETATIFKVMEIKD